MPRRLRHAAGGYVYHVLNRAAGRATLFAKPADYGAFRKVLVEAHDWLPMRLLAYSLMPNHWHLVLWPAEDGDLSEYMRWLTVTHTQRWHAHYHTEGTGPLYQGRFKAFPIAEDEHLLTVVRYVERNPLRANLVTSAAQWRWSSLGQVAFGLAGPPLDAGPVPRPGNWVEYVEAAQTEAELAAIRRSVSRGAPFGAEGWQKQTAEALGLQSTLRPRGRPKIKRDQERGLKTTPDPFSFPRSTLLHSSMIFSAAPRRNPPPSRSASRLFLTRKRCLRAGARTWSLSQATKHLPKNK
jgi:putative transposase